MDKCSAFAILYSHDLIQNSVKVELSTRVILGIYSKCASSNENMWWIGSMV